MSAPASARSLVHSGICSMPLLYKPSHSHSFKPPIRSKPLNNWVVFPSVQVKVRVLLGFRLRRNSSLRVAMVDHRAMAPLQLQRRGRYLELKRSSPCKRKPSCALPSPSTSTAAPYKGVRMRMWGKWVTEVRDPVTKTRIWLGSFATAEMAARAYDAAMVCLKGPCAPEVNFPDSIPSFVVSQCHSSPKEIQAVALAAATASVPAAAPLAMADACTDSASLPKANTMADAELHRDGGESCSNASWDMPEPECSWSNVETWIDNELEELEALGSCADLEALVEPFKRQLSDSVEQLAFQWPLTLGDYEHAPDCFKLRHDAQLWSFA